MMRTVRLPSSAAVGALLLLWLLVTACDPKRAGSAGDTRAAAAGGAGVVATSADDVELSMIASIDVDAHGRIFVADLLDPAVIVLRPDGTLEKRIGRHGRGPGEFLRVNTVQVLPGDSLLVFDGELSRVAVFPPGSARPAYTLNLWESPSSDQIESPRWVKRLPATELLVAAYAPAFTRGSTVGDVRRDVVRLLHPRSGLDRDSVLVLPSQEHLVENSGRGISVTWNPFGRQALLEVGHDGRIYSGWTDTAAVGVFSAAGERLGRVSADGVPPRVTTEDVQRVIERWPEFTSRELEPLVGSSWPAMRRFVVDESGSVWVGLPVQPDGTGEWVRFSADGARLGTLVLPGEVELYAARGGLLYGVTHDEWDVPRIVVLRPPEGTTQR